MADIFIEVDTGGPSPERVEVQVTEDDGMINVWDGDQLCFSANPLMAYWLGKALMALAKAAVQPIVEADVRHG